MDPKSLREVTGQQKTGEVEASVNRLEASIDSMAKAIDAMDSRLVGVLRQDIPTVEDQNKNQRAEMVPYAERINNACFRLEMLDCKMRRMIERTEL
jgi:hypothetical protein